MESSRRVEVARPTNLGDRESRDAMKEQPRASGVARGRGIILKSAREIELMRASGRVVHRVLQRMGEMVAPGVTTGELNQEAENLIAAADAKALFRGVEHPQAKFPFPAALCISVNEQLVHGIPGDRRLCKGDVVSIDCGVRLQGYCADSATTLPVGEPGTDAGRLLEVTKDSLSLAISLMKPGKRWSEVARQVQRFVESAGMSVVRDFVGHGIGRDMHEEPKVPNYHDSKQAKSDFELVPGLVLAVEPMVNLGGSAVRYGSDDGWVVVTRDGQYAAHFEHTVAVVANGVDVLTDGR
ncbi:MAG: type I methionyl aminopeptidase [Planctomycetota bacterium]